MRVRTLAIVVVLLVACYLAYYFARPSLDQEEPFVTLTQSADASLETSPCIHKQTGYMMRKDLMVSDPRATHSDETETRCILTGGVFGLVDPNTCTVYPDVPHYENWKNVLSPSNCVRDNTCKFATNIVDDNGLKRENIVSGNHCSIRLSEQASKEELKKFEDSVFHNAQVLSGAETKYRYLQWRERALRELNDKKNEYQNLLNQLNGVQANRRRAHTSLNEWYMRWNNMQWYWKYWYYWYYWTMQQYVYTSEQRTNNYSVGQWRQTVTCN
jgi:hypothetical protein